LFLADENLRLSILAVCLPIFPVVQSCCGRLFGRNGRRKNKGKRERLTKYAKRKIDIEEALSQLIKK
jgi:hypothetical protein